MGSGARSSSGVSPNSITTDANFGSSSTSGGEKPAGSQTPEVQRTRRLKFAQPPGAEQSPTGMRRVSSSPGSLQRMATTSSGSLSRIARPPPSNSLDTDAALAVFKSLAAGWLAVGSVMLAVCNAGPILDFFAASASFDAATGFAAHSSASSRVHSSPEHRLLTPLVRAVWAAEGRDDNYSGSEPFEGEGPSSAAGPVAAIVITCLLALVALAVAKWPEANTTPRKGLSLRGGSSPRMRMSASFSGVHESQQRPVQ